MKKDNAKAAKRIVENAVKKTGAKKVGDVWNMTPTVRKLERAAKK